jgi:hypothetical protein
LWRATSLLIADEVKDLVRVPGAKNNVITATEIMALNTKKKFGARAAIDNNVAESTKKLLFGLRRSDVAS